VQPGFFPILEWPDLEADRLPPTSSEVRNEWSYIFTPPTCLQSAESCKKECGKSENVEGWQQTKSEGIHYFIKCKYVRKMWKAVRNMLKKWEKKL
jgi:hypothetical protein